MSTIPELFAAGCTAVAAGSNLVSADLLANADIDAIMARTRQYVAAVAKARGN